VEEVPGHIANTDWRHRYYQLTLFGRYTLAAELTCSPTNDPGDKPDVSSVPRSTEEITKEASVSDDLTPGPGRGAASEKKLPRKIIPEKTLYADSGFIEAAMDRGGR